MREIKFRAKSTETKLHTVRWRFGSLLIPPNEACNPLIYERFSRPTHDGNGYWYEVEADTVGQFTGLKDAKGKEIYEGDILLYRLPENMIALNNSDKSVVFYRHGMFLVSHGKIEFSVNQVLGVHGDDAVVIGNIHDNPELLRLTKNGGLKK